MLKAIPKYLARCNTRLDKNLKIFYAAFMSHGHTIIVFGFGQ